MKPDAPPDDTAPATTATAEADPRPTPAAESTPPSAAVSGRQLALILVAALAVAIDGFVVLVFRDRVDLVPFLAFTTVVAGAAIASTLVPREVGHGLAVVLGAASVAGSIGAFVKDITPVLPITLLVAGGLLGYLAFASWRKERAGWSFLVALAGVMFVCTFFGAPKVHAALHVSIWLALIIPGLLAVTGTSLVQCSATYRTTATD